MTTQPIDANLLREDERALWRDCECASCEKFNVVLRRLIEERQAQRWIPVSERLPAENHPVEVYGMKRLGRAIAQLRNGDEWLIETCSDMINMYPPKFWRELPPSPVEETRK